MQLVIRHLIQGRINILAFWYYVLIFFPAIVFGQNQVDTLAVQFKNAINDTARASVLVQLSEILYLSKPDTVIPLCNRAIEICNKNLAVKNSANKNTYLRIKAAALNNIGYIQQNLNYVKPALDYYFQSAKIQEEIGDISGLAQSLNNIGFVYQGLDDTIKAFMYYEKSLHLREGLKENSGIAQSLNNLGLMYRKYGDPSCKSKEKNVCQKAGTQKALAYYLRSLELKKEVNDAQGIGICYNNIGSVYSTLGDLDKALEYFNKSLEIRKEINDKNGMSIAHNNIGNVYFKQKKYAEAEKSCATSLQLAKELKFTESIRRSAEMLYKIYTESGNYQKALQMHELYIAMRDSLTKRDNALDAQKQFLKSEYEKKAAADSVRVEDERKVIAIQMAHNKKQNYFLITGLMLVILFSLFVLNRYRITQKQKQLIEQKEQETQHQKLLIENKQKEIVDSINYAQKIQNALLAGDELLNANLPLHFVMYLPKAIVSGDFYWATHTSGIENNGLFYLAVCDSTGHGVPGAFMSLLNTSFLNEAVIERKLFRPADILNHVRLRIKQSFTTGNSIVESSDGMDCSLIVFDRQNKCINYCCANNPIVIVRSNENNIRTLIELPFNKMPVGKHERDTIPFEENKFDLVKGDMIYLFTDGFADQFGGPKGKKFMYKQLEVLLTDISNFSVAEQKKSLLHTFEEWKGTLEQVDDVCVIGIQIT